MQNALVRTVGAVALLLTVSLAPAADPTVLVRVERRSPDDLVVLRSVKLPIVAETTGGLLFEGTAADLARLEGLGFRYDVLDERSATADYLVVALDGDRTVETLAAHGSIVLLEENLAFLRIERDAALPSGLEPGCFAVDLLNRVPVLLPTFELPTSTRSTDGATPDPIVQQIVDAVDDATILSTWQDITDNPPEGTRFSTSVGCEDAADYCYDHYATLGLLPEYDPWRAGDAPNVVADIPGATDPDEIYILVGHLDDLPSSGIAPGADDNGSGTVTVLEGARVMSCYAFRKTVRFVTVTGEEQGLLGSKAYAAAARTRGDDIRGVLNFDMNGWEGDGTPDPENIDISYNAISQWLGELYAENATTYQTGLVVDAFSCPSLTASDHAAFWQQGYPAIIGITDNHDYCGHAGTYPDYHASGDTIAANGAPTLFYASIRTAVATLSELAEPFVVTFGHPSYACDGAAEVVVADAGRNLDPGVQETIQVVVRSDSEPAGETVTLTERGLDSKLFSSTVSLTVGSPVGGDGLLSVTEGDLLRTEYVDALDCAGNADASYEASAVVDCTGPVISGVGETGVTGTAATIVWNTNEPSAGSIVWGETVPPTQVLTGASGTTAHAIELTGLQECTVYRYEVRASDEAGNETAANNGGQYYSFETFGDFGAGLQPCSAGQVSLDEPVSSCNGQASFHVVDLDLNDDPLVAETAVLRVTSTTETTEEIVVATESGPNTARFEGAIETVTGAAVPDGRLQTAHDDVVTVTYHDGDDGTGAPGLSYAIATVDCEGPKVTDLRIEAITDARATVAFTTDEPGDAMIEWGTTPALGETVVGAPSATAHAVVLNRLATCSETHFRIRATDRFGHQTVVDDLGAPHRFQSGLIPGLYWKDDFEGPSTTWTLEGEWEIGTPLGIGGSTGLPDPAAAYNADRVLGHDLTGQGSYPGDFEPAIQESARSPELSARDWTDTRLLFHKRLNTGATDAASVFVEVPQGYQLYRSYGVAVADAAYRTQAIDIGPLVDGKNRVTLRFTQDSTTSGQYSGWNIDDVILKDGSLPDYGPCGSCGSAPSFSGASSAADDDACADSGVTVGWARAVSWGSGGDGTYAVYRGDAPGFTPSGANLITSGVGGSSFTDNTLAAGATGHYLVRAENDEACASGPANGGVTDQNTVYRAVANEISHPLPGTVADLAVDRIGSAHLRLAWSADPDATMYRVYRSNSPLPGAFGSIGEAGAALHDDLDAGANRETYFYVVRAVSACGDEGP